MRQAQRIDLRPDRVRVRTLPCQNERKRQSFAFEHGAAFQNAKDILLPVDLAAVKQDGRIGQMEIRLGDRRAFRVWSYVRRAFGMTTISPLYP
jgi:hypothetical protein